MRLAGWGTKRQSSGHTSSSKSKKPLRNKHSWLHTLQLLLQLKPHSNRTNCTAQPTLQLAPATICDAAATTHRRDVSMHTAAAPSKLLATVA
jgi:hypothetical protein